MRKLFIKVNALLILVSNLAIAGQNNEAVDGYIFSMNEFKRVCSPLLENDAPDNLDKLKGLACQSYFSGVISGVSGSISVSAEYDLAQEKGVPRHEIESKMESDHSLHDELSLISENKQLICLPNSVTLIDVARASYQVIPLEILNSNFPAYYPVVNSLVKLYPCR